VGRVRGDRAGTAAGKRAGASAGGAQRDLISAPSWYYARLTWHGDLPTIADSYDIDPGPERANYIENGEVWYRDLG
jgi:hypothetical protein